MIYLVAGLTVGVMVLCSLVVVLAFRLILSERETAGLERAAHAQQIAALCQRLQAPEMAVVDHSVQQVQSPTAPPVPLDDDVAQWAAQGIESKDELADRLFAAGMPA